MTSNAAFLLLLASSLLGCGTDSRNDVAVDWPVQGEIRHELGLGFGAQLAILGSVVECDLEAGDEMSVWVERVITGDRQLRGSVVKVSYPCRRSRRIQVGHVPVIDVHVGSRGVFFLSGRAARYYYGGGMLLSGESDEDRVVDFLEQAGSFEELSYEEQLERIREWLGSGDAERVYFGLHLLEHHRRADMAEALLEAIMTQFRASTHPRLNAVAFSVLWQRLRERQHHPLYGVLIDTLVGQLEDADIGLAAKAVVRLVRLRKEATGLEYDVDGVTPVKARDAYSCRISGLGDDMSCDQWLLQGEHRRAAAVNWRKWFSQGGYLKTSGAP